MSINQENASSFKDSIINKVNDILESNSITFHSEIEYVDVPSFIVEKIVNGTDRSFKINDVNYSVKTLNKTSHKILLVFEDDEYGVRYGSYLIRNSLGLFAPYDVEDGKVINPESMSNTYKIKFYKSYQTYVLNIIDIINEN